jgi:hypothetical protein
MNQKPAVRRHLDIAAIITMNKDRVMGGRQLTLLAENEPQMKEMAQELAMTLRADIVQMKNGDHLIVRE